MTASRATRRDNIRAALGPRIRRLLEEMWEAEDAARSFDDPEGVHQMRVATRRIRSILQASGDAFEGKPYRRVSTTLRRLTRALGPVRDGDVLIGILKARDGDDRPGVRRLIDRLSGERDEARAGLLALLDELDDEGFREASLDAFRESKGGRGHISRKDARHMIREHVDDFIAATTSFPAEDAPSDLHRIRIATKRLRYGLQLLEEPLRPGASQIIPELSGFQDELGEIHNLDVLIDRVRDELHAMTDEAAGRAIDGHNALHDDALAQLRDLLTLLHDLSMERASRYQSTRERWTALVADGFRDDILALTSGPRSKPGTDG